MRVRIPSGLPVSFPVRLMVGQQTLTLYVVVRVHHGDPVLLPHGAIGSTLDFDSRGSTFEPWWGIHSWSYIMTILCTEMWGTDKNKHRSAKVYRDDEGFFVEVYEHGEPVRQIDVREHSINYAEDTADNWIWGIIKE